MSGFQYRLKRLTENIGGQEIVIECLENLDQTIDDLFKELEKTGNASLLEELCPYFGTLWPSARALSEKLVSFAGSLRGQRIIELGCGLALPSLLAAKLGAEVIATDFHPEVPRFLERNLLLNGIDDRIRYLRADWRTESPELGHFDWVIGSDVLYEKQHALQLARTAASLVRPEGRILIADPARPYLQAFVDELNRMGFDHDTEILTAPDHPKPKEIFLVTFSARKA